MNLIVGGGVIGLPYAAANFGYMGFVFAISSVLCVAMTTQYFNLCAAEKLNQIDPFIIPGYEELGYYASGKRRWGEFYFTPSCIETGLSKKTMVASFCLFCEKNQDENSLSRRFTAYPCFKSCVR